MANFLNTFDPSNAKPKYSYSEWINILKNKYTHWRTAPFKTLKCERNNWFQKIRPTMAHFSHFMYAILHQISIKGYHVPSTGKGTRDGLVNKRRHHRCTKESHSRGGRYLLIITQTDNWVNTSLSTKYSLDKHLLNIYYTSVHYLGMKHGSLSQCIV